MKHDIYRNAVTHLEFSEDLYDKVISRALPSRRSYRVLRDAALVAAMVCLLATTAFAVSAEFRSWTITLLKLGTSREELSDSRVMEFRHSEQTDGVTLHYLELDRANYSFSHGMLTSPKSGHLRITEDYQLLPVEMSRLTGSFEKNGRSYSIDFTYCQSGRDILSTRKDVLHKNALGELFLNATDGNSHQWPAYVNLETGAVRDALPGWTEADFSGRVIYSYELRGGILVATLVDENKVVSGNSVAYNLLYWIADGASEALPIQLPEQEYGWYCENDALYCKNVRGHLYRLNEAMEFELLYDYETGDDLTNGLYTVATDTGELAIIDVYTGDKYTIPGSRVDPGSPEGSRGRLGGDIDETMGYNATRYDAEGTIALVKTQWIPEEGRVALEMLGVLDKNSGELKLLEIENDYNGYTIRWLDGHRLAVIYDEKYLCVYEFRQ